MIELLMLAVRNEVTKISQYCRLNILHKTWNWLFFQSQIIDKRSEIISIGLSAQNNLNISNQRRNRG